MERLLCIIHFRHLCKIPCNNLKKETHKPQLEFIIFLIREQFREEL
jgi:hypothetical protein